MKNQSHIRNVGFENIFELGVQKLKNIGFVNVTKENILSDEVYLFFFARFAIGLKGKNKKLDNQIDKLFTVQEHNK